MRTLRLISTTAAILLLGAGAVSAQGMKTDETPGAPAAQQNAPPEKMAPAAKSDQIKAPEKTGQAAPTTPESSNKPQTTDKGAPAGAAAKVSSDADGSAGVKSKRTARHVEPDMRVVTMDRCTTATEAILATAAAEATVIAGHPGSGVNSSAVCKVTARNSEDRRTSTGAAFLVGSAATQKTSS